MILFRRQQVVNDCKQFEQAQEFINQKKYFLAVKLLTDCYTRQRNFRTNYLLFQALTKNKQYQAAWSLAQDYLPTYISDDDLLQELFVAMGHAGQYIAMHKLYRQLKPYMTPQEIELFLVIINDWENKADRQFIRKIILETAGIELLTPISQRSLLKKIYCLPLKYFLRISQEVLPAAKVHPLIKNDLLDTLRQLKVKQSMEFLFIDGQYYRICPQQLADYRHSQIKQQLFQLLSDQTDQQLISVQQAEISLKLQLLYPFAEQLVKANQYWLKALLTGKTVGLTEKEGKLIVNLTQLLKQWST